jgi:hypothetical protein
VEIRAPAVGNGEYKKGSDSGILSQAVSYLSWLESAHHEFEALVKEKLGAEEAESIDWRNPRMVCIAASFSHHDRVAVQRLGERIDLVRYRIFRWRAAEPVADRVRTRLSEPDSGPAAASRTGDHSRRRRRGREAARPGDPGRTPGLLRGVYAELDEALTVWGEVEVAPLM